MYVKILKSNGNLCALGVQAQAIPKDTVTFTVQQTRHEAYW